MTQCLVGSCQSSRGSRPWCRTTGLPPNSFQVRPRSLLKAMHSPRPVLVKAATSGASFPCLNPEVFAVSATVLEYRVFCGTGGLPLEPGDVETGGVLCEYGAFDFDQQTLRACGRDPRKNVIAGSVGFEGPPKWVRADAVLFVLVIRHGIPHLFDYGIGGWLLWAAA